MGKAERVTARPRRGRGVALITAMLVTAIASMVGVEMLSRQVLDLRRVSNVMEAERAYLFALGVETWAGRILAEDGRDRDTLGDDWARIIPPLQVEGAEVVGRVQDLQGRFNLNNLRADDGSTDGQAMAGLRRLLAALDLDTRIANAVADWVDADVEPHYPDGAEDESYLVLRPPYRAANRPMVSPSELRLVLGVDADTYEKLAPFVTVLPERTPLNVNTAPMEVLMTVADGVGRSLAEGLAGGRGTSGYASVQDFMARDELQGKTLDAGTLSVASRYFLVQAQTRFDRGRSHLYSVLRRDGGGTQVVLRSQGVY